MQQSIDIENLYLLFEGSSGDEVAWPATILVNEGTPCDDEGDMELVGAYVETAETKEQ